MPLQDHFRPPLSLRRHWHAFHNAWATYISSDLNQRLPEGYFAEANVQFGIGIDVATFEEMALERTGSATDADAADHRSMGAGGVWVAPAPTQTVPITLMTD